jgi:hypothetical protein
VFVAETERSAPWPIIKKKMKPKKKHTIKQTTTGQQHKEHRGRGHQEKKPISQQQFREIRLYDAS